ncbi:hypothetical protein PCANC_20363 [Puccinia coronata f. sp. avenae]|uniref:Uncharacterized protein n=1 Tax=Puccinia coronata f. sp. avenae TaxID=200324 RepID=A0A2N5U1Q7_9BASI|nr:hypothetical protein PCANC_20363 [Puccinia coronata f. sp. avenae]
MGSPNPIGFRPVLVEGILRCARLVGSTGGFGEAPASGCQLGRVTNGQPEPDRVQAGFGHGFVRKTRSWTDPFKQLAGSGQSRAARRAQPPEGSNRVVHSRSCLLAPEKTQVPRRPQGSSAPPPSSTPPTGHFLYAVRGQPEVPAGSMIVPGKHQTRWATRRQPAGSMSWSRIWARGRPEPAQLAS